MFLTPTPAENAAGLPASDRILILGAGYGGLRVAQLLRQATRSG